MSEIDVSVNGNYCANNCPGHLVTGHCSWFSEWLIEIQDLETGKIEFFRCEDCIDWV